MGDLIEIAVLQKEITRLLLENGHIRHRAETIRRWCKGNIDRKTQAAAFCVQVKDLLEIPDPDVDEITDDERHLHKRYITALGEINKNAGVQGMMQKAIDNLKRKLI